MQWYTVPLDISEKLPFLASNIGCMREKRIAMRVFVSGGAASEHSLFSDGGVGTADITAGKYVIRQDR